MGPAWILILCRSRAGWQTNCEAPVGPGNREKRGHLPKIRAVRGEHNGPPAVDHNQSSPNSSWGWRAMNPLPLFQGRRFHLAWACSKFILDPGPSVWDFTVGVRQVLTILTNGLRASSSYYVGMHVGVLPYAATAGRSINSDLGLRRRTVAFEVCAENKIFTYINFSQASLNVTFSALYSI